MRKGLADQDTAVVRPVSALLGCEGACGHIDRGVLEKVSGALGACQQRSHLALQCFVSCARFPQEAVALCGVAVQRGLKETLNRFPPFDFHGCSSPPVRETAMLWRPSSRA